MTATTEVQPTAEELLAVEREDSQALLHAILTAVQARTWTESKAVLMKALEASYDGQPEPLPEDEAVYDWRNEVVEAHRSVSKENDNGV
jgi:hypothetical protein